MASRTRRAFHAGLAAAAVLALAAPAALAAPPTYALVQYNQQALFFVQMNEGARAAAKKLGAELVIFDANSDAAAQTNAFDAYIQQKVQGIIVEAVDVNGIMPSVKAADAAGIPVVAVDSILPPGPQKAQVGVDNLLAGKMIGQFFMDQVKTTMGGKARLGIVGALNSFIQNQRQKGFQDIVATDPAITLVQVVDGHNTQDGAMGVSETLMTANPDMTAIYATGEPALLGAVAAVDSGGHKNSVKIVGWDLTAQAIKGIDEGFVLGVVQQDPAAMGAAAVMALDAVRRGQAIPTNIAVPVTIVTKANVDPYRAIFK